MEPWLGAEMREFLETEAGQGRRSTPRHRYYHHDTAVYFDRVSLPGSHVLLIGYRIMALAESLTGRTVWTLDVDPMSKPPMKPHVRLIRRLSDLPADVALDVVLLPFTLQFVDDIQGFLETLHTRTTPTTRIVVLNYNFLWAPLLKILQTFRLRAPLPHLHWLNNNDVRHLLRLTGFEAVSAGSRCFVPFYLPIVTFVFNRFVAPLPGIQVLCQKNYVVGRPRPRDQKPSALPSVSVMVPARNEAGNIRPLLDRLPALGSKTEVIFVEGHSRDNTWEMIQQAIAEHPRRDSFTLKAFKQSGKGKADAVWRGFAEATGDILIILDADLSVPPESLPRFIDPLVRGVAEFANGSRLVYRMESEAMQVLNLFFNKLFGIWVSWIIEQRVKDTLCGTKALYRQAYVRLWRRMEQLAFKDPFSDFLLLFGAAQLQLKIADIPVPYKRRTYGSTNILRFRNGWELLRLCLTFWPIAKR